MNNIEHNQDVTKDAEGQSRLTDWLGGKINNGEINNETINSKFCKWRSRKAFNVEPTAKIRKEYSR